MRSKRLRKHRTRFHLLLFIGKVLIVWYLAVFSVSYLTSNTTANFTDMESTSGMIYAGNWVSEDESELMFIENGNKNVDACEPITLKATIKNKGEGDMLRDSTYDVYYIDNGNPKKHGERLDLADGEGTIEALKKGETAELTFKASKPGRYVFVAYQHYTNQEEVWSKEVKIKCKPGNQKNMNEVPSDEIDTTKNNEKQTTESEETSKEENAANEEEDAAEVDYTRTNNEEKNETDEDSTTSNNAIRVEEGEDGEKE